MIGDAAARVASRMRTPPAGWFAAPPRFHVVMFAPGTCADAPVEAHVEAHVEARVEAPAVRALFRDPGEWRVVRWGDFRALLAPQLAAPARIGDDFRLPCWVQLYELLADRHVADVAAAVLGDASRKGELQPFDGAVAERLALPRPAAHRGAHRDDTGGDPQALLAGALLFRITPASDPTASPAHAPAVPAAAVASPVPADGGAADRGGRVTRAPRAEIPARFLDARDFAGARDSALAELAAEGVAGPSIGARVGDWVRRLAGPGDVRRWRAELRGRALDEQLWTVRPPASGATREAVRAWAREALAIAGYGPRMVDEWELYWRRRDWRRGT